MGLKSRAPSNDAPLEWHGLSLLRTVMVTTDPETRFRQTAARGNPKNALALLGRLVSEDAWKKAAKGQRRSCKITKKK